MVKLILYGMHISPPTRAVLLTLHALELDYEFREVDLLKSEQFGEEFKAKNPQHTVPTLELEDGQILWESHAIMAYLVSKYNNGDSLYPQDLLKRAVVDQRLHYESGVIFPSMKAITYPLLFHDVTKIPKYKINALVDIYDTLELFLSDRSFIAGDQLTIADFSVISTVSVIIFIVEANDKKYPRLIAWFRRMQELPYYEAQNSEGARALGDMIKNKSITIE